ncbi:TPA: glycosyltransferase family 2 protein [Citrobacter freundii]
MTNVNLDPKGASEVSVIITCYNDSSAFKRCLASVIEQTVPAKEIIVVDDCSDDSQQLEEIIKQSGADNVTYLRNSENKNGAYSRNRGMSSASGAFIGLLDGDDYWALNHIEESLKAIKEKKADFIYSNVIEVDVSGNKKTRYTTDVASLNNKNDVLFFSPPQTNSFFFKRAVFSKVKFDETLRRHQDYQFLISCINEGTIEVKYNNMATTYYCESHRPGAGRMNFHSMFSFWNAHAAKFSHDLLNAFLKLQIHTCLVLKKGEGIDEYFSTYPILKNKDLYNSTYIRLLRLLGYRNQISRSILYLAYHVLDGKLRVIKK